MGVLVEGVAVVTGEVEVVAVGFEEVAGVAVSGADGVAEDEEDSHPEDAAVHVVEAEAVEVRSLNLNANDLILTAAIYCIYYCILFLLSSL